MKKLFYLFLFVFVQHTCFAQFFKEDKNITKYSGYFNFYYDDSKDKIYLEIRKLESEFLYVNALSEGVGSNDIGLDRGKLGGGVVVFFRKAGNKILMIQPNQDYRALTDNVEERKSIKEAFAKSVLHGFVIKKEQKGVYLVDATSFFMQDTFGVSTTLARNGEGNYNLDKSRSAFNLKRTKAFEKNVEFDVLLTFKGKPKGRNLWSVTPDASAVTVYQHHSFVELPDNNYKPRVFDPRAGGYPMSYMDYSTPVNQSIVKRFIYRHRLEKKNPNATVSEAVEPIVYYLDPGTPEPIRSALLDGARWWNQAFEAIGYKDAFQVKMLPEDADPMDVPSIELSQVAMGLNGDLIVWSSANPINVTLNMIPASDDDDALSILAERNRVGRGKTAWWIWLCTPRSTLFRGIGFVIVGTIDGNGHPWFTKIIKIHGFIRARPQRIQFHGNTQTQQFCKSSQQHP